MLRYLRHVAVALLLGGLASYAAADDAKTAKKGFGEPVCNGDHGTSVKFEKSPSAAATKAAKEEKLVLVIHISGYFEEPDYTWNNAEALRVNALADPKVGQYLDKYFVCAFQRVGTFRIVGKAKQGGNVASYFCAPDGRVLHAVAGPVNSATFLREAKWIVETAQKAVTDAKGDGGKFKIALRTAHAEKLRKEHGLAVEPVTFDPPEPQDPKDALTYRDPTGQPLAPILKPAPIDGPDVTFRAMQEKAKNAAGGMQVLDRRGRQWVLGTQGRVEVLLAAHSMAKIDKIYASVFEGILGERISTRPVEVVDPFPWRNRGSKANDK